MCRPAASGARYVELLAGAEEVRRITGRPRRTSASGPAQFGRTHVALHHRGWPRRASSARRTGGRARSCCTQCPCAFEHVWATPSSVRLMASARRASARVGWSQCMQITGTVCGESRRSMKSSWIIDCPFCVSHIEQAWTRWCTRCSVPGRCRSCTARWRHRRPAPRTWKGTCGARRSASRTSSAVADRRRTVQP